MKQQTHPLNPNSTLNHEGIMRVSPNIHKSLCVSQNQENDTQTVEERFEFTRQEVYEWICEQKLLNHKEFKKILLKEEL